MSTYTYSISGDITSGECDIPCMHEDILSSTLTQAAKDALGALQIGSGGDADRLDVDFPGHTLSGADEAALDGVVADHDPLCPSGWQLSRVSGFVEDGTTNNNVCHWNTEVEQEGDWIEYVPDAALGDVWRIRRTGIYTVTASAQSTSSGAGAMSINVGTLTNTQIGTHNRAIQRAGGSAYDLTVTWRGKINRGEEIWIGEPASYGLANGCAGGVSVTL